mmetsp:Transcript_42756/g.71248  ORF Transcript_42756/g.71248 Transcript_42756/m.71248 type:complete len:305 (-) Transcript_42756:173-1087(-)|eukprot:jgi/Bigna1/88957/estExt_fgenesh1_pg.C_410062
MATPAPVDETVSDLVTRYEEHKSQLEQVGQLLRAKPGDPTLMKLYDDLKKVVELTEDLKKTQEEKKASEVNVGDRCEAVWSEDGKWYTARIDAKDPESKHFSVTFLVYGNAGQVAPENIRPYRHARKSQVRVGMEVRAYYETDGLFYPATVETITSGGLYRVAFRGYNYKVELPLTDILPIKQANDDAMPEKAVIPEHLKIKSTDNDKQKDLKKKKIKAIKSKFRKRKAEMVTEKKKNNWKQFLNGGKKKLKALKNKKRSIFASPDSVDGRVGVVGSGKAMTNFHDRTRHTFDGADPQQEMQLP